MRPVSVIRATFVRMPSFMGLSRATFALPSRPQYSLSPHTNVRILSSSGTTITVV